MTKSYNSLTNLAIKDKNYEHVLDVCKTFRMNIMKDYHDLHLIIDISLSAYVFETFRKESINSFELGPTYCLSAPRYTWDAIERLTCVRLNLIADIEKYQLIESMTREVISVISDCYTEANKFLKLYNPNKPTSYLIYLDANNLYVYGATSLNFSDLVNPEEFNLDNYSDDCSIGCFLEVDFNYLNDAIHDLHNGYLSAAEEIKVTKEMLPEYQLQFVKDDNFSLGKNKSLIPNLGNKGNHKLHYKNLKLYLKLGLQFKKSQGIRIQTITIFIII